MDQDQLLAHAKRLANAAVNSPDWVELKGIKAQSAEFLRVYSGSKSSFYQDIQKASATSNRAAGLISSILLAFAEYVEAGLYEGISPERKAEIDVVSDILDQARRLLDEAQVHPAAPAVLIGASLEEYLRSWAESESLTLKNRKPSIDSFAAILRDADLITKQDHKDITSWAGLRNHAAHGEWDQVADSRIVNLMLEGVNLFMRKYTG